MIAPRLAAGQASLGPSEAALELLGSEVKETREDEVVVLNVCERVCAR